MELTAIHTEKSWHEFHTDRGAQQQLLQLMPAVMQRARWFGGKGRILDEVICDHCLELVYEGDKFFLVILEVRYKDYEPDYYFVPLAKVSPEEADKKGAFCLWNGAGEEAGIIDATVHPGFQRCMFNLVKEGARVKTGTGIFNFDHGTGLPEDEVYHHSENPRVEQSNSSVLYNGKFFMKIYRKLFREANPEFEMLKFLTEQGHYNHVPAYAGGLSWERRGIPPITLALMMQRIDARKDNWESTGDELNGFLHAFLKGDFSIHEFVFENVELLAQRTAEMHVALSTKTKLKAFKPEPFDDAYRQWLLKHLQQLLKGRLLMAEQNKGRLDEEAIKMAEFLSERQSFILKFFEQVKKRPLESLRTRIHGDYHLGQVLYTGGDFMIIDFEGEPESSIIERKIKHSPLKDVAGMIRSFHYAVSSKLYFSNETRNVDRQKLQRATDRWFYLIRDTFLETYLNAMGKNNPVFYNKSEVNFLLHLHLMEKAIYELGYELNGRPDWVKIPLKGIEQVTNELEKYLG